MAFITLQSNDNGFFAAGLENEVLHIRFRKNLLSHLSDLSKRDNLLQFIQDVLASRSVKVILINSDFREAGCEEYARFFLKQNRLQENFGFHRLCNLISQLILGIRNMDRLVIHASQGNVISTFLNISMACDYRIAADNTVFCNAYLDLGLIPIGAGPYFFSQVMGQGKALETILLHREISVQQAEQLGLVDQVIPLHRFDELAMRTAVRFAEAPASTIAGVKRLMSMSKEPLETCLEFEKQEMIKILNSESFLTRAGA